MKFKIEDEEHAKGGKIIEANSPDEALELYVENECDDLDDDDEVNVIISDTKGNRWEGTAEVSMIRHVETYCCLIKPKKDLQPER